MYLDDIKSYAGTVSHMISLLSIFDRFNRDIAKNRKSTIVLAASLLMTEPNFYNYQGILQGTLVHVDNLMNALLPELLRLLLKWNPSWKNNITSTDSNSNFAVLRRLRTTISTFASP